MGVTLQAPCTSRATRPGAHQAGVGESGSAGLLLSQTLYPAEALPLAWLQFLCLVPGLALEELDCKGTLRPGVPCRSDLLPGRVASGLATRAKTSEGEGRRQEKGRGTGLQG